MLYNRFAQHVVNDKKKMYKRGSQWVVASAFALAIGGFGVTQTNCPGGGNPTTTNGSVSNVGQ